MKSAKLVFLSALATWDLGDSEKISSGLGAQFSRILRISSHNSNHFYAGLRSSPVKCISGPFLDEHSKRPIAPGQARRWYRGEFGSGMPTNYWALSPKVPVCVTYFTPRGDENCEARPVVPSGGFVPDFAHGPKCLKRSYRLWTRGASRTACAK